MNRGSSSRGAASHKVMQGQAAMKHEANSNAVSVRKSALTQSAELNHTEIETLHEFLKHADLSMTLHYLTHAVRVDGAIQDSPHQIAKVTDALKMQQKATKP